MSDGLEAPLHVSMREIQQAIVEHLARRGLVVPGRPYSVDFDVALFALDEEDSITAIVRPGAHA